MVERQGRQLAAVMFCDMVGFTAAMQEDEQSALESRDRYRSVIENLHDEFGGEIVQYYGDGTLSIFSNSVDAVRCAIAIQRTLGEEPVVPVRVGLHVGDVVVEEHGLLGDAVNVASRIESFGQPGAVPLSRGQTADKNHMTLSDHHHACGCRNAPLSPAVGETFVAISGPVAFSHASQTAIVAVRRRRNSDCECKKMRGSNVLKV